MRARQRECDDAILIPNQNDLRVSIDRGAIARRNRIAFLGRSRHRVRRRDRDQKRRNQTAAGFLQEDAAGRAVVERAAMAVVSGHWAAQLPPASSAATT